MTKLQPQASSHRASTLNDSHFDCTLTPRIQKDSKQSFPLQEIVNLLLITIFGQILDDVLRKRVHTKLYI